MCLEDEDARLKPFSSRISSPRLEADEERSSRRSHAVVLHQSKSDGLILSDQLGGSLCCLLNMNHHGKAPKSHMLKRSLNASAMAAADEGGGSERIKGAWTTQAFLLESAAEAPHIPGHPSLFLSTSLNPELLLFLSSTADTFTDFTRSSASCSHSGP